MANKEKLKELEELAKACMYSKDNYTDEDRKALCDGCKEECKFNKKEEPVIEDILDMSRIDYRLQHNSIEDGIKYHAEEYSFNIESELFHQLTGEQQKLWRKELERAVISGGYCGLELSRDKRYKENQEPVSENLEKEINSYFAKWLQGASDEGCFNSDSQLVSIYDCHRIARHFANWQKQKDESKVLTEEQCRKIRDDAFELGKDAMKQQMERYRIEHCKSLTNEQAELEDNFVSSHVEKNNRIPTFIDAIEYGIEYGKQQMMKEAVDTTVHIDAGGYPYIPQMELYDYDNDIPLAKKGDKYKVILIKEE